MRDKAEKIISNIQKVFRGDRGKIELCLIALLADGHMLIEDIPGVGKTLLARSLALSIKADFKRVQFTSDLLPADITGVTIYSKEKEAFIFKKGPIFTNILLADEINRASPKAQSALLEAMNERKVTVDHRTYPLPRPFFVIATQNPLEFYGTFPLPESQLDRFLVRIELGYPSREEEKRMLFEQKEKEPWDLIQPVVEKEEILEMQREVKKVKVEDSIADYILNLIKATRESPYFLRGASPRASLMLMKASQARAFLDGRDYVVPDDVKKVFLPVIAHRIYSKKELDRRNVEKALLEILQKVEVPL